jgi:hypothetical protein
MKITKQIGYLGLDQYGDKYVLKTDHPRQELLRHFARQHCAKMYRDKKDGGSQHVGWIIAGRWIEVFRVSLLND